VNSQCQAGADFASLVVDHNLQLATLFEIARKDCRIDIWHFKCDPQQLKLLKLLRQLKA
jgi:hypothetical protein